MYVDLFMCACAPACMYAWSTPWSKCVCACVHACVCACVYACVCACMRVCAWAHVVEEGVAESGGELALLLLLFLHCPGLSCLPALSLLELGG